MWKARSRTGEGIGLQDNSGGLCSSYLGPALKIHQAGLGRQKRGGQYGKLDTTHLGITEKDVGTFGKVGRGCNRENFGRTIDRRWCGGGRGGIEG